MPPAHNSERASAMTAFKATDPCDPPKIKISGFAESKPSALLAEVRACSQLPDAER